MVQPGRLVRDEQIAHIFRNMRAAMRLPREAIARRLATTPGTIEDLESGAISSLPHWRETVRIVRSYCELLRLDPEPLLWRIQQILRDAAGGEEALPSRSPGPPPGLALRPPPARERRRRESGTVRRLLTLAALPCILGGLVYAASQAPAPFYRAAALLPVSLAGPARIGLDNFVLYSAPRHDGLRWIDVGDPQLRKGNKLRTKAR